MLRFFRRKKSSFHWVLWLVIIVLGAGMVFLFVDPPSGTNTALSSEVAAVGDATISVEEFRRQYGQLLQLYQQQFGEQFEQFRSQLRLGEQALNGLITDYAVSHEAERMGLSATPAEISERITALPVFHEEETGRFIGVTRYQQILNANNMTAADFESSIRRQVLREKLLGLLSEGIEPDAEAIRQDFVNENQQVKIRYAYLDPETLSAVDVSDEELQSFYESNSAAYTLPEKRKVVYLRVPIRPENVELKESEIEQRLADIPLEERVRASHILFSVPPGGENTEARNRASRVLRQIRNGADFAEMARAYSEDDRTSAGGDLGFFGRGQMVPEFETVAFSLGEGQVSDLVETPFGVHIIKVTAKPASPEASQRASAEFELRKELAEQATENQAEALLGELREGATIEAVASREGLQMGESPYFVLEEPVPDLGTLLDFNQQVFALGPGEFFDPYASTEGFLIGRLADTEAAELQDFAEVRDRVVEDYQESKREELATRRARDLYRAARDQGSLEAAAKSQGLEIVATDFFEKGATVDDIVKFSPVLHDRAFTMSPGEVSPPVPIAGKQIVFEVVEKTEVDVTEFENQKDEITEKLRQAARNSFITSYIQNIVDQLRRDDQITVNQELVDAITG